MKRRNGWGIVLWFGLMAVAGAAWAQGAGAARKQVEASMRIEGEIVVDGDGRIADYTIRDPEKLPQDVLGFVRGAIGGWSFEPPLVDGKSVSLRNEMSILLVAKKIDDDSYLMRVQATSFQPKVFDQGYTIARSKMDPPRYPMVAAQGEAQGTVYLVVKVGRDGRVHDVVAEQVNLRVVASANMMGRLRAMFATSSIAAARKWEFTPPTRGAEAQQEFWSLRIPVEYSMAGNEPRYGRWVAYVPGPRQKPAWVDQALADESPEALAAGEPKLLGEKGGLRLLTPLSRDG